MSRANGQCCACRRPVLLALNSADCVKPLDPEQDPAGGIAVHCDVAGTWRTRALIPGHAADPQESTHMPHYTTCKETFS